MSAPAPHEEPAQAPPKTVENHIVHLETRVITTFGVVDAEGNVRPVLVQANAQQANDSLLISKFTKDKFDAAFTALQGVREQLKCQQLPPQ